jgi:hypothetical protein
VLARRPRSFRRLRNRSTPRLGCARKLTPGSLREREEVRCLADVLREDLSAIFVLLLGNVQTFSHEAGQHRLKEEMGDGEDSS